jgi:SAM-dependent methyltransferase
MAANPLADVVSSQYERWMYPQPILDLQNWLIGNWQWFDPSHAYPMFWPDRPYKPGMDILIAGCGTNQAAVFAYTNPKANVVAIDVSGPSLDHHRFLKNKYGMKNLELHKLPIEDVGTLNRDFDLIVSTGVLHHMADPQAGMNALAGALRREGVLAIMLYAKYGRLGVDMLQSVFRDLGLGQTDTGVLMVKEALATLPQDHPVRSYMSIAPDLRFDAGLVDTFLHGRERSYTVPDCLDLVRGAGLAFQGWFLKSPYYAPPLSKNPFQALVASRPEEEQWPLMEKLNFRNGCHFFMACRADRPEATYRIGFDSAAAFDFVPGFRYRCGLNGRKLFRHNWTVEGNDLEVALATRIDGRRTISEIAAAVDEAAFGGRTGAERDAAVMAVFQSLWRLDFLTMGLSPAEAPGGAQG